MPSPRSTSAWPTTTTSTRPTTSGRQADFNKNAPGLDWAEYFRGAGMSKQKSFIVWQPTAFAGESALVASESLDTWKDWLAYHMIEDYAGFLSSNFADERFDFFGKTLSGAPQQRPRWQRGIAIVNRELGDDVGQIYAQKYFPPEVKGSGPGHGDQHHRRLPQAH